MNDNTIDFLQEKLNELLINASKIEQEIKIKKFLSEGLTEWESSQVKILKPNLKAKIPVTQYNPYASSAAQSTKVYYYGLANFPKNFNVPVDVAWSAHVCGYTFWLLGGSLDIKKDKKTYNIGRKIYVRTKSKAPSVKNKSTKFFK